MKGVFTRLIIFIVQKIRIFFYWLISSETVQGKIIRNQPVLITGSGLFRIGNNSSIGYFPSPFFFSGYAHIDLRKPHSYIEIGNDVQINNNATLIADGAKITIKDKTLIGTGLVIYTSDFHHLHPQKRLDSGYERQDVTINENVFIGSNVTILKGTTIGKNSIIANGSIVNGQIPENVIAGGIPCRVLKNLHS